MLFYMGLTLSIYMGHNIIIIRVMRCLNGPIRYLYVLYTLSIRSYSILCIMFMESSDMLSLVWSLHERQ